MKLSLELLQKHSPCAEGMKWYQENGCPKTVEDTVGALLKSDNRNRLSWANWLLASMLSRKDKIRYAIYAAEQVVGVYEKKYPDDKRPRKAIEAAKAYLKKPSLKNKNAAYAAAYAAYAAANAAYAAYDAAYAAANATYAAVYAAAYAAYDAYAAYAAYDAYAAYAAYAAYDAANEMKLRIINYGLKLL